MIATRAETGRTEMGKVKLTKLSDYAVYVEDKISSDQVLLDKYITTDNLLQNRQGRSIANNLPPQICSLVRYKKGDILISNIRPYLKKIWYADDSGGASTDVLVIRAIDPCLSKFVYSVLLQDDFYDYTMKACKGSKMPRGDKSHIMHYPIHQLKNPQIIGELFTAFDDKIALNKRINDKLEAMAKRLYDYWFVQFDFPDENGRPYKSSGGKMVWNETLKREIPEGWEVKPLKQFASYRTDTTKSENAYNYVSTDNMLPDKHGISDETIYPASGNIFQYKQNDILISNIRPYFKKIWFASHCGTCSRDIICIYSNQRQHNCYIYRTLWRDDFFDYVMQGAKGSKMPRGDKEHIMNYPICCHNYLTNVLLKIFNDKCTAIQEMLYRNNNETMRLTALRERLLPLLMNGQVEMG